MQLERDIAFVRVTTPRAFGRAGIRFAAGITEMDLLDLTAQQIVALASEPMFVFEAYHRAEDEWVVFPAPAPADLPILEAELALAKAAIAKSRVDVAAISNAIAGGPISGLSEATKLATDGAYGLAILPGDGASATTIEPIGALAAATAAGMGQSDDQLGERLAAEAGRPDDDTDKPEDAAMAEAAAAPTPPPAPNPAPEAAVAADVQAPARAAGKAKPAK